MQIKEFILAAVITIASTTTYAIDPNGWTNIGGNASHTRHIVMITKPANYRVLWTKQLGELLSNPIIVDNVLVVGVAQLHDFQFHKMIAVDTKTGNLIWQKGMNGEYQTTPITYDGERMILDTSDEGASLYSAYNLKDGELFYSSSFSPPPYAGLVSYNSNIFYQSNNVNNVFSIYSGKTGKMNWTYQLPEKANGLLAVDDNYIVMLLGNSAKLTGSAMIIDLKHDKLVYQIDQLESSELTTYPILNGDKNAAYFMRKITPGRGAILMALDLLSHQLRWIKLLNLAEEAQPALVGNILYSIADDTKNMGNLYAIDTANGNILWNWQPPEDDIIVHGLDHSIVATDDVVFIPGEKRTYAVSMKTHETVWQIEKAGSLFIADDKLFIVYSAATITAISLS